MYDGHLLVVAPILFFCLRLENTLIHVTQRVGPIKTAYFFRLFVDAPFPDARDASGNVDAEETEGLVDSIGVGRLAPDVGVPSTTLPAEAVSGAFELVGMALCGADEAELAFGDSCLLA